MCGIAGIVGLGDHCQGGLAQLESMLNALRHRGPDGDGVWCDTGRQVYFGHRRLAIQDLSDSGRQPMQSRCGRYVIIFNGEIYNFKQLKAI